MKTNEKYLVIRRNYNYVCNHDAETICGYRFFSNKNEAREWGRALALEEYGIMKENDFPPTFSFGHTENEIAEITSYVEAGELMEISTYTIKSIYEYEMD